MVYRQHDDLDVMFITEERRDTPLYEEKGDLIVTLPDNFENHLARHYTHWIRTRPGKFHYNPSGSIRVAGVRFVWFSSRSRYGRSSSRGGMLLRLLGRRNGQLEAGIGMTALK